MLLDAFLRITSRLVERNLEVRVGSAKRNESSMDTTRDALLRVLLLERALPGFCFMFSSVVCRFPGSFEDALLLPLLLERRSWPVAFSPDDGSAVSRLPLRPPLLVDRARGLVRLFSLERTSSSGFSSISDGRFLLPLLLERPLLPRLSVLLERDFVLCFSPIVQSVVPDGENESSKLTFDVSTLVAATDGPSDAVFCGAKALQKDPFDESKSSSKLLLRLFDTSGKERSSVLVPGRPCTVVVLFDRLGVFLDVSGLVVGGSRDPCQADAGRPSAVSSEGLMLEVVLDLLGAFL